MSSCEICKGMGFLLRDVEPGHADFGRLFPCRCRREEQARRREERLMAASGLVGMLLEKLFHTFRPRSEAQRAALEAARAFAQQPERWLTLVGGTGQGKTHLAAAIANARLVQGQPVLFVVVPDLLDHLRSTFKPDSEVEYDARFEEIREHPLLILDDLGAEKASEWAGEKLFQIFNHRYNKALPTVITTDLMVRDLPLRIAQRIQTGGRVVRVDVAQVGQRQPEQRQPEVATSWIEWAEKKETWL